MTGLRYLDAGFDLRCVASIDAQLALVAAQGAHVLLAIESGSRAWGFPSPDSDYDCRFIYVRPRDDYLTLFPKRDVIEFPTDGLLDVNGWDVQKALRLLLKGNAVVIEWLTSPFAYAGDPLFRKEALDLAQRVTRPEAVARHYLHLGERQRRTYFSDTRSIALKKVFYALRPAVALRWLRLHPGKPVAPMHFPTLIQESELPSDVLNVIADCMVRKAATREMGRGPLPGVLGSLIDTEFAKAHEIWDGTVTTLDAASAEEADDFFRRWVSR